MPDGTRLPRLALGPGNQFNVAARRVTTDIDQLFIMPQVTGKTIADPQIKILGRNQSPLQRLLQTLPLVFGRFILFLDLLAAIIPVNLDPIPTGTVT